jgi:hypothetical protein
MGIFAQIQSAVDSILPQLYEDEDLVTVVTWKRFSDNVFNEALGVNEETYTDFPDISAIKVEKTVGTRNWQGNVKGDWDIASGDVVYLFRDQHVPADVSVRDLIVDGALTYSVKKIFPVFNLIVKVEVEGYA